MRRRQKYLSTYGRGFLMERQGRLLIVQRTGPKQLVFRYVLVPSANGSVPDYDDCIALESAISAANSDAVNMKVLATPGLRGLLKSTQIFSATNGLAVWQNSGQPGVGNVAGYDAYASNQVPSTKTVGTSTSKCHSLILGD